MAVRITEVLNLLSMTEEQSFAYVLQELRKHDYSVHTDNSNYVFAIPNGKCFPLMYVAHLDTVQGKRDLPIQLERIGDTIINLRGILGADDRAGVAITLDIVRRSEHLPYVLFTTGEESGCIGAKAFCKSGLLDQHAKNIFLMVELDRRGFNELVTYRDMPEEVLSIFSMFGYEKKYGSVSDVASLSDHSNIAHVNISCGFISQHTAFEQLLIPALDFAVNNCLMIQHRIRKPYFCKPRIVTSYSGSSYKYGGNFSRTANNSGFGTATWPSRDELSLACAYGPMPTCACCGKSKKVSYLFTAAAHLCSKCVERCKPYAVNGNILPVSVDKATYALHRERSLSKDANRAKNSHKHSPKDVVQCPRCGSTKNVSYDKYTRSYWCESFTCNYQFWIEPDGKRVYVDGDNVVREGVTTALDNDKHFKECEACTNVYRTNDLIKITSATSREVHLCSDCVDEAMKVGLINEKSLKYDLPWEE